MFLSSQKITEAIKDGRLDISPFCESNLKSVGYTLTLSEELIVGSNTISIPEEGFILQPGDFVIGRTIEVVNLNNSYLCFLSTRSSLAQQGIDVLQSSFIAEPNANNSFTLEISNNGKKEVVLKAGMKIVKVVFGEVV